MTHELIKPWREEFEILCAGIFKNTTQENVNGFWCEVTQNYGHPYIEYAWKGFLVAKRCPPLVKLPSKSFLYSDIFKGEYYYKLTDVIDMLNDKDIPYTQDEDR